MNKHANFTVLGKPFFSIGGQTHNSSSYPTAEGMDRSFESVQRLGGNTIATPVCWDAFEPQEGSFDVSYVHGIIDGARSYNLHLVILWFGTWKNGTMEYTPAWVKTDKARFPRTMCKDGTATSVLSAHAESNLQQDKNAFCKLMEVIKAYDEKIGTVIAVQVENEPGILGATRIDFGSDGRRDFASQVPGALITAAKEHGGSPLGRQWAAAGKKEKGSWAEVFGAFGAEACTAWFLAKYIDAIARAGKEIYDLFLYTNVWLGSGPQSKWDLGGLEYPCGGAVEKTLEIWYAASESLDAIAPDIYLQDPTELIRMHKLYANPDRGWPLHVPESHAAPLNAGLMFNGIGNHAAIGYHIFAVESVLQDGELTPNGQIMQRSMSMLSNASPLILKHNQDGKMHTLFQQTGQTSGFLQLAGNRKCWISYRPEDSINTGWLASDYRHRHSQLEQAVRSIDQESGRGLLFQTSDNEFYLVGHKLRLFFNHNEPEDGSIPASWLNPLHQSHAMEMLILEEGHFEGEEFVSDRRRSGDEARHGIWAQADCGVIHFILN